MNRIMQNSNGATETMKAVRFFPPGGPEKLKFGTEPKPKLSKPGEVLIKVHAVGLIWPELYWPVYQRQDGTYYDVIPGHDFSGVIVEISPDTDRAGLEVGSEVYAFTSSRNHEGAMAEFAVADIDQVLPKPKNLSFVEAAAVPLSALTAWQALFDHGSLKKGQRVLITGAAGGTGIWATQFAKRIGAYVIGTGSSERSREILKGLGLDQFVDYSTTTLKDAVKDVDLVLECVGGKSLEQAFEVVREDGTLINICDPECAKRAPKHVAASFFIVSMNKSQLSNITDLIESQSIRPVVDSVVDLENTPNAYMTGSKGHIHGKIVIKI